MLVDCGAASLGDYDQHDRIRGREPEQVTDAAAAACVALTRGTGTSMAYVFTLSPRLAGPAPGPRPAPELARYDKITTAPARIAAMMDARKDWIGEHAAEHALRGRSTP